jgi:hypothetical protein
VYSSSITNICHLNNDIYSTVLYKQYILFRLSSLSLKPHTYNLPVGDRLTAVTAHKLQSIPSEIHGAQTTEYTERESQGQATRQCAQNNLTLGVPSF